MIWCNRLLKMTLRDLRDEKDRGRSPAWSWWHWCRSADACSASLILFLVLLLSLLLLPLALAFVVLNGLGHGGTRLSLDAFPSQLALGAQVVAVDVSLHRTEGVQLLRTELGAAQLGPGFIGKVRLFFQSLRGP